MSVPRGERCDAPACERAYAFVGEDKAGVRWAVCDEHRLALRSRWAWLKTRDGRFPFDPNARSLTFPEAKA